MQKLLEPLRRIRHSGFVRESLYRCAHIHLNRVSAIAQINVELVNYCNLRCRWCTLDHSQDRYVMKEDLLRRLFDNLLSDKRFRSVKNIFLWNGGETLLHPDLTGMLRVIKERRALFLKNGLPFPKISLLTNGTLLSAELSGKIIDANVLNSIGFSVDGGTRERYEEIRIGAQWETTSENIRDFTALNKGRIRTRIICMIDYDKPRNTRWMSQEFRALLGLVDHLELRYPHDFRGDIRIEGHKKVLRDYCYFLLHSLVVLPNGDMTVCCADLKGAGAIGNLYDESLYDIYNSEKRRNMISDLLKGRRGRIELCKNCDGY